MRGILSLLAVAAVVVPSATVTSAAAARYQSVIKLRRAAVVGKGVQLTLTVPQHVYPQNALVRVHIRV